MTGRPEVAVVIACYTEDRWESVIRAVDSVREQTVPCELIVAVDYNEVLLERLVQTLGADVRVVRNAGEKGAAGARNTGVLATTAEYVAFMDDDGFAERHWIQRLLVHAKRLGVIGVGGRIDGYWLEGRPWWFPPEFGWSVGETAVTSELPRPVRNLWTGSFLVSRQVFLAAGGFRAGYGKVGQVSEPEDTELCLRISRSHPDGRWVFVPNAVMHHEVPPSRSTFRYFAQRCWYEGAAKARLAALFPGDSEVLSEERAFLRNTALTGLMSNARACLRGDLGGLGRGSAVSVGVGLAVCGYLTERLKLRGHVAPAGPSGVEATRLQEVRHR